MIKVDDIFGVYIVKESLKEKAKDGHKLYLVECTKCHKQFKLPANSFAYTSAIINSCKHLSEQEKLDNWLNEKHICECCGKIITKKIGSGRFCSQSCANTRVISKSTREKIAQSLKAKYIYKTSTKKLISKSIKGKNLAQQISLSNSPYNEFDAAYVTYTENRQCYYLVKHDINNKIIKRSIVPVYKYIVEQNLGYKLDTGLVVHHIDFDPTNNSLENLQILTRQEHNKLHRNYY